MKALSTTTLAVAMSWGLANLSSAATITIINADGAGEGLNDPAPRAPTGGNSGTTLGQQRLIALQAAAAVWAAELQSNIEIKIQAQFNPITSPPCDAMGGVVGTAGPSSVTTLGGSPPVGALANTFYPIALAEALEQSNLNGATVEITSQFNSDVDGTTCFGTTTFHYGINPGPVPGGTLGFLPVALHEFAHGLGFTSLVCDDVAGCGGFPFGSFRNPNNFPDIWAHFVASLPSGELWLDQTDAERGASMTADPNLVWTGPAVTANVGTLAAGTNMGFVRLHAPPALQRGSSVAHFSSALSPNDILEPVISAGTISLNPGRGLQLLDDIGWNLAAAPNPDRIFFSGFE